MKKPDIKSYRVTDNSVTIHNVGHGPHETAKAFDDIVKYGLALSEKETNRKQHCRDIARKPRRKAQAIFDFVKIMYEKDPSYSDDRRLNLIKKFTKENPYRIGNYSVYWYDNLLWQDDDAERDKDKALISRKKSTYRAYLKEIRKELKKADK